MEMMIRAIRRIAQKKYLNGSISRLGEFVIVKNSRDALGLPKNPCYSNGLVNMQRQLKEMISSIQQEHSSHRDSRVLKSRESKQDMEHLLVQVPYHFPSWEIL